jgi:hypothetical protein
MSELRFDPDSPGVRRLARACFAEADTVQVRVVNRGVFQEYVQVTPDGLQPQMIARRAGELFSLPRNRAAVLVERGIVELA